MASPQTKPTWAALQQEPSQQERQVKLNKLLHSQIMDFRVNSPLKLQVCVEKLIRMFQNISQNPEDQKYRKVKSNNATFRRDVLDAAKQVEEFLLAAGWHTQVEQMEKYWIYDAAPDSPTWRYLQMAQQELQSAQSLIQQKAERHAKEAEERKTGPQKQRELLLKQIEADKASRKDKFRPLVSGPHSLAAASPSKETTEETLLQQVPTSTTIFSKDQKSSQ